MDWKIKFNFRKEHKFTLGFKVLTMSLFYAIHTCKKIKVVTSTYDFCLSVICPTNI